MLERVDYVDAADRPVRSGPRGGAARAGLHHRVAATVLTDPAGRVLVYRRPAGAAVLPGHHDVLIGGSVRAGEEYAAAAARELTEELGLRPAVRTAEYGPPARHERPSARPPADGPSPVRTAADGSPSVRTTPYEHPAHGGFAASDGHPAHGGCTAPAGGCTAPYELWRERVDGPSGACWLAVHHAAVDPGALGAPDPSEIAWYGFHAPAPLLEGAGPVPFNGVGLRVLRRMAALLPMSTAHPLTPDPGGGFAGCSPDRHKRHT